MKILFLFCDMLRANRLSTFNPDLAAEKPMDVWMKKLGGTAFRNCYSPAPDTPRSLACLYTGLYPNRNGCRTRIHWPTYYLNPQVDNIFSILMERNYQIFSNFSDQDIKSGILPDKIISKIENEATLQALTERAEDISKATNAFVFVNLPDYHHAVFDYGGGRGSDRKGNKFLSSSLDLLFSRIPYDEFDWILLFSDHGCKLNDDQGIREKILLLNDDRSKIVMFLHKRGDLDIKFSDSVTSICDVYPTIRQLLDLGEGKKTDGISLFKCAKERAIVIEDHSNFTPSVGGVPSIWAVRTENHFYIENLDRRILFSVCGPGQYRRLDEISPILQAKFEGLLRRKSFSYREIMKENQIMVYYKNMKSVRLRYSDGTKRPRLKIVKMHNFFGGVVRQFKYHLQSIFN